MKARYVMGAILLGFQAWAQAEGPKPLIVEVGHPFVLILASNPTTGYQWQLAAPLDQTRLKLLKSEYQKPQSQLTGADGKEMWQFKPVAEGKAEIRLKYVRPWESNAAPAQTTNFVVRVVRKAGV